MCFANFFHIEGLKNFWDRSLFTCLKIPEIVLCTETAPFARLTAAGLQLFKGIGFRVSGFRV